ncbi:exosome complex component Rrp46 [Anticarsia gemmatalis]|uniref:exosome complex component Rrp46 n=1 Tax=Anticarsia gemmatalis TaxID=129554 RepID=UPI003F75CD93
MVNDTDIKDFKLRPMKCECNYLTRSDGSAILSQGRTVALANVNGPLDIKMQSQSIEKATLEVYFSSKGGKPCVPDRYREHVIRSTCETAILSSLYPRTGIVVNIQELEDHGGFLACSINACCLALLNSGLAMRHTFAAVTCAIDERGNIQLDPTTEQLETARASMTYVFESREKSLVTCFTQGSISDAAFGEAMEHCRSASELVFSFYKTIVSQYSYVLG